MTAIIMEFLKIVGSLEKRAIEKVSKIKEE